MSSADITLNDDRHADPAGHYDPVAGKLGMWLFLFTEVLLFGTLFIVFAVYLHKYRHEFQTASVELHRMIGALNTLVLLTSSLTMALSIAALERAKKRLALGMLAITILCAIVFMAVKTVEWTDKFSHGVYPKSVEMAERAVGEQVFYGLYFTMTGLHALHVAVGAVVILAALVFVQTEKIRPGRIGYLDNVGLYWHLVDVIWVFLFPLFYLIG